jgi:hypothetical protein
LFGRGGIDDNMSIATEDYETNNPVLKERKNLKKLKRILMHLIKDEDLDLKDAFDQWQHKEPTSEAGNYEAEVVVSREVKGDKSPVEIRIEDAAFIETSEEQVYEQGEIEDDRAEEQEVASPSDGLTTEDLESWLNRSTESLKLPEVDLTINDVHIDTSSSQCSFPVNNLTTCFT